MVLAALNPKTLYAIDIHPKAIDATKTRLPPLPHYHFLCQSHADFPSEIGSETVDLIVYNLGYLPGGDKNATTETASTLQSLQQALLLLKTGGLISVTCYPGHLEGAREESAILEWARTLDPKKFTVQYSQWINRQKSPSLLFIEKKLC